MFKQTLAPLAAITVLGFAPAVSAQQAPMPGPAPSSTEFQASGGIGYTYAPQIDDYGSMSATGRLGLYFNEWFGVEGEGTIGLGEGDLNGLTIGDDTLFSGDLNMKIDNQVAGFLVGRSRISPQAEGFIRLGYGVANTTVSSSTAGDNVDLEFGGFAFGLGGTYFFQPNSGIRLDLTSISSGSIELEGIDFEGEIDIVDQDGDDLNSPFTTLSVSYVHRF